MRSPRHLPRLAPEYYGGHALVHWSLTVENRGTGRLTSEFHACWQLVLLHASARYQLVCPLYVLMPDHAHLIWCGIAGDSDQRLTMEFLRKHVRAALVPHDWQRQAYDHVLRENERERGALQRIAHYILENPVRARLVPDWSEWPYLGCCVPGYPELDVRTDDYWERFWRLYNYLVEKQPG